MLGVTLLYGLGQISWLSYKEQNKTLPVQPAENEDNEIQAIALKDPNHQLLVPAEWAFSYTLNTLLIHFYYHKSKAYITTLIRATGFSRDLQRWRLEKQRLECVLTKV